MAASLEPPPDPAETKAQRRARVLTELESSLAEGTPAIDGTGWQYPPAPLENDTMPAPSLSWGVLILLGTVVAVAVIAVIGPFG